MNPMAIWDGGRGFVIAMQACAAACVLIAAKAAAEPVDIRIDASERHQELEGWGASLCWWAGLAGKWNDPAKIDEALHAIVDRNQLNMSLFRYNIGAGDDPSHRGGHMVRGKGARAEMEGFKASADAPYDWTADAAQRRILLRIRQLRPDAVFEAFANSPPWWMTFSGCSGGNKDPRKDNLRPENIGPFCDYLVAVCRQYRTRWGIEFRTLEPFNEPRGPFWTCQGSQEGCWFSLDTQAKVIRALAPKLARSGLKTAIAAADDNTIGSFAGTVRSYRDAGLLGSIGQLNVHTYGGNARERAEACELVEAAGKRFWMSESGPIGIGGSGLANNLAMTQRIFDDLKIMRPVAWLDWQLAGESNDEWCVLRSGENGAGLRRVKNFYVRMQLSRFFPRGSRLVGCDCREAMAALSPDGRMLAVAVLNEAKAARRFRLAAPGARLAKPRAFRTSATEDCAPISLATGAEYEAPAQSLTTFLFARE